jgi:hypothetical protein
VARRPRKRYALPDPCAVLGLERQDNGVCLGAETDAGTRFAIARPRNIGGSAEQQFALAPEAADVKRRDWMGRPSERLGVALEIIFKAALFFWAGDEVLRGINPWRRCLGITVLCYGLWTLPR